MRLSTILVLFVLVTGSLSAQPWEVDNSIFNPSGIPSLSFSQPRCNDIDEDGDFDFWLGNTNRSPLYIQNDGNPSDPHFVVGTDYLAGISYLAAEVAVNADLNGDGVLDLISGGYSGLHFFVGSANFGYTEIAGFFGDIDAGSYPVPDLADIDTDGDLDLILGFSESGAVRLYPNSGSPAAAEFLEANAQILTDVGLYAYPVFCDFDNDLDYDILIGRDVHGFVYLQNEGSATDPEWSDNSALFAGLGNDTYWNSGDLADLNGDGLYDLLYGTASGPLQCYFNSGSSAAPTWQENTALFGGTIDVGGASSPFLLDFDGDGDLDLLTGTQMGDIKYFANSGGPYDPAWVEDSDFFAVIDHSIYAAVTAGDLDDDGLNDVIVGDLNGGLYYYRNTGTALVYNAFAFMGINVGGWSCPRLVDLDHDGDLDLVVGDEDGYLSYFANTGTPEQAIWELQSGYFAGIDVSSSASPSFADLDEDGDLDLVAGSSWGDLYCYLNENGSWVNNNTLFAGISTDQNAAPALVDLDHDGDYDLILGDYDGTFKYYRNLKYSSDILNPPRNLTYEYQEGYLISWEAPAEGSTSPFEFYNIYLDGEHLVSSPETFWLFDSLEPGDYLVEVTAQYIGGESIPAELQLSVVSNNDLLQSPIVLQNYPNPFSRETTISYSVKEAGPVSIKIYNLKGQLVKALVQESKAAGQYRVVWDGTDHNHERVLSGIFLIQMKAGRYSSTRKMIMMQ